MDYQQMTSPCGIGCFNCPMYLANEDTELRAKISKMGNLSYEKAKCEGCRNAYGAIAFLGDHEPL